jgi:hypothetical protein
VAPVQFLVSASIVRLRELDVVCGLTSRTAAVKPTAATAPRARASILLHHPGSPIWACRPAAEGAARGTGAVLRASSGKPTNRTPCSSPGDPARHIGSHRRNSRSTRLRDGRDMRGDRMFETRSLRLSVCGIDWLLKPRCPSLCSPACSKTRFLDCHYGRGI